MDDETLDESLKAYAEALEKDPPDGLTKEEKKQALFDAVVMMVHRKVPLLPGWSLTVRFDDQDNESKDTEGTTRV